MFITEKKNNYIFLMDSTCVLSIRDIINAFIMEKKNNYYVLNG